MYPPPVGPDLSAEQRQELDDTFLSSDPFEYFRARIAMLLRWEEAGKPNEKTIHATEGGTYSAETATGRSRTRFAKFLGQMPDFLPEYTNRSVTTQVATDAYALRHHAAESLVRLTATLLKHSNEPGMCVWDTLSTGPNQLDQVIEQLHEPFSADDAAATFTRLVIIQRDLQQGLTENLVSATNVFSDWLEFAISLLTDRELQFNADHNKVKHGLAVRARDDLKVSFATKAPNSDRTIPLSALTGPEVFDIFDRSVIEILAQAPKVAGHKQGLELTQLRIDIPAILAEAYMIAWVHGAMFNIVATNHFANRSGLPKHLHAPRHPGYPVGGPHPRHIAEKAPPRYAVPSYYPSGWWTR
ncbi:hypothetical protein ACSYDW_11440 [Paeniglutamicibacter sp. R2-26]|uniref:hypothetical protein n=1 Tax=Paeniglutamicibacter sp. R2-26 TaxID=3144417 RepID=UPI003EE6F31C